MKLSALLFSAAVVLAAHGELVTRDKSVLNFTPSTIMMTKTKKGRSPTSTTSSASATSSPIYPYGYPLCSIPNSDLKPGPGNATALVHQQVGSNVLVCVEQCRADVGDAKVGRGQCKSILFESRYTMCLFYDVTVEDTRQVDDKRFRFRSWDKDCWVG
ncbi:hypothetical protein ONS95_008690 [Cadophora gregata]|uniref:uncharacterized protein n=1 Tax=Cadophora gregata TaxID=51156 RepID=UPI0026DB1483|nr:uncharacterized protein ONS95_008690 [Cadophora gregata]KAK0123678.1 hypothetical protein ONS95_008690 [Cadophora gregata]KAK0130023.1 hypothetical protein ONS96_000561 [Cadophora gregata f. sp. sojae]